MYQIVWGSPDAAVDGLYLNNEQVVSWRTLWKAGYDYLKMRTWSQEALKRVAENVLRSSRV